MPLDVAVVEMLEWPSIADSTSSETPASIATVAAECLKSWNL